MVSWGTVIQALDTSQRSFGLALPRTIKALSGREFDLVLVSTRVKPLMSKLVEAGDAQVL